MLTSNLPQLGTNCLYLLVISICVMGAQEEQGPVKKKCFKLMQGWNQPPAATRILPTLLLSQQYFLATGKFISRVVGLRWT